MILKDRISKVPCQEKEPFEGGGYNLIVLECLNFQNSFFKKQDNLYCCSNNKAKWASYSHYDS